MRTRVTRGRVASLRAHSLLFQLDFVFVESRREGTACSTHSHATRPGRAHRASCSLRASHARQIHSSRDDTVARSFRSADGQTSFSLSPSSSDARRHFFFSNQIATNGAAATVLVCRGSDRSPHLQPLASVCSILQSAEVRSPGLLLRIAHKHEIRGLRARETHKSRARRSLSSSTREPLGFVTV